MTVPHNGCYNQIVTTGLDPHLEGLLGQIQPKDQSIFGWVVDDQLRPYWLSATFEAVTGVPAEEVLGSREWVDRYVVAEDRDEDGGLSGTFEDGSMFRVQVPGRDALVLRVRTIGQIDTPEGPRFVGVGADKVRERRLRRRREQRAALADFAA